MTSRLINHDAKLDAHRIRATARRVGLGASSLSVGLLGFGLAVGVMTPLTGLIAPTEAVAQERDADYSQFYDQLEEHGRWMDHPRWGYVWLPHADDGTWRPYTVGNWVNTEEHGWYWNSDEPWGWATYHYGRWVREDKEGWIWIPGREWAPAWVAWREGDEYIGWAPLPPEAEWEPGRGELRFASSYYDSPRFEPLWIFCRPMHMVSPGLHRHIVPRSRAPFVLRSTRYVTNYSFVDRRVYNRGVRVSLVERGLNRSLPFVRIVSTDNRRDHGFRPHAGEHRGGEHQGGDHRGENRSGPRAGAIVAGVAVGAVALGVLNVFRPKLAPRSAGGPPPAPRNFEPQSGGRGGSRGPEGRPVRPAAGVPMAIPTPGGSNPGNLTPGNPGSGGQPSIMRPPRSTEGQPQRPSGSSAPKIQLAPVQQPPSTGAPPITFQRSVSPGGVIRSAPPPPPPVVQRAAPPPPASPPVVQRAAPPQRTVQPPPPPQRPAANQPRSQQPPAGAAPQGQGRGQGQGGQKRNPNDPNQPPVR